MANFVQNNNPTFPRQPQRWYCQLTSTVGADFLAAGANGSEVDALFATSTDTAAQTLLVNFVNSVDHIVIDAIVVSIPAGAGTQPGTPAVDILAQMIGLPKKPTGTPYMTLGQNDTIAVEILNNPATGKHVNVIGMGADY